MSGSKNIVFTRVIPLYVSRAKVRAVKIKHVEHVSDPEHGVLLYCDGLPTPQFVQASQYSHRTPHAGMFWLGHDDGQMSFMEPEAFDHEYVPA